MPTVRSAAFRPSRNGLKPALQTDLGFTDISYPIRGNQKDRAGRPDTVLLTAKEILEEQTAMKLARKRIAGSSHIQVA